MHISELRIRNFRNFLTARFRFEKGVNTLVGENGSGKTNALFALRLLIDDSMARNAAQLRESDFCRALGDWQGHWIVVSIDFAELDPSEGCQVIKHAAGHMDGSETGTYSLMFRPRRTVRSTLFEMTNADAPRDEILAYLKKLTLDDYESLTTGRGTGDFLDNGVYNAVAGDLQTLTFPDPDEEDQGILGVRINHPMHAEVSCTFAQALRDVVSDLRRSRFNPLLALLRGTESSIAIEDAEAITQRVVELNSKISELREVRQIASGVQETLHGTVGHTYSPTVTVESALPESIDRVIQRLTLKVGDDPGLKYRGDLTEQSLGGANLIYLALKLLEFEYKRSSERVAHFLLVEEPEAHIHTHIQKTLFERQSALRTQVIVSTHSTHVSSAARISSVNVLVRVEDHAEVCLPASGLQASEVARLERYLDAVRSTLLFAKGVVLVEGETELIMIPALWNAVFGVKPDELGVSIISMESAVFRHVALVFHDDRIRRRCAIITDSDQALATLPNNPDDDSLAERRARNAQKAGERRRDQLEVFAEDNRWVQPFFANHTFEVDFVQAGNADGVVSTLDTVYESENKRTEARVELESEELATAGARALKMANRFGKGWFAVLLAEQVSAGSAIPDYLLRAVAFASGGLSPAIFKRMILYRLENGGLAGKGGDLLPDAAALREMEPDEVIRRFEEHVDQDVLGTLLEMCAEYTAP